MREQLENKVERASIKDVLVGIVKLATPVYAQVKILRNTAIPLRERVTIAGMVGVMQLTGYTILGGLIYDAFTR